MKTITHAVGMLLGLSLVFSGCEASEPGTETPDAGPQDPAAPKTANLTVRWSVKKADGTAESCAAPYDKVMVVAQAYSGSLGTFTGSPFPSELSGCGEGTMTLPLQTSGDIEGTDGFTPREVNGTYDIHLVLTEASGEIEHIVTHEQKVDLASGDKSLTFTFYPSAGFRYVNWGPRARSTGDLISCAAAGVDTVRLRSKRTHTPDFTPDPVGRETVDTFPCDGVAGVPVTSFGAQGGGISSALEAGYYTFVMEAYSGGTLVGQSEPQTEEEIQDRGRDNPVADGYFIEVTTR